MGLEMRSTLTRQQVVSYFGECVDADKAERFTALADELCVEFRGVPLLGAESYATDMNDGLLPEDEELLGAIVAFDGDEDVLRDVKLHFQRRPEIARKFAPMAAKIRVLVRDLPAIHPDDADELPELREVAEWREAEFKRRLRLMQQDLPDPDRERIIEEARRRWPWAYGIDRD